VALLILPVQSRGGLGDRLDVRISADDHQVGVDGYLDGGGERETGQVPLPAVAALLAPAPIAVHEMRQR
jgi:hypothetical protein